MSETVAEKARRYLGEGRLCVERVDADEVLAHCRGGSGVYPLGFSAERGWWCSCQARGRCCHLVALRLITSPLGAGAGAPEAQTAASDSDDPARARAA